MCLLGYPSNSSKERCFIEKITIFQPKIPIIRIATKFTIVKINYETFLAYSLIIAHFVWVGKQDFREGQVEK